MLSRLKAIMLLHQCTGVDIWSLEICRRQGVPESWIQELADCFESGFDQDAETIYYGPQVVNQYEGVHDLHLARRLAAHLGIDVTRVTAMALSRESEVRALREAADE